MPKNLGESLVAAPEFLAVCALLVLDYEWLCCPDAKFTMMCLPELRAPRPRISLPDPPGSHIYGKVCCLSKYCQKVRWLCSLPRAISSCQYCFHTYPFKSTHSLLPLHSFSLISLWNSGFLGAKVRLVVEMLSGNFQNKNLPRPVAQWAWLPFWNQRGHWQKAGVNKNSVSQRINALLQEWRFLSGKCQAWWVTALYPYSDWLWSSGSSVKEQI